MRRYILCFCAVLSFLSLVACKPVAKEAQHVVPSVAPPKPRSPHNVMVGLAGQEPMTRDQQAFVILLQDKIAERWQPVPAKLRYSVGIEFTLTRPGLCSDVRAVSSMGSRKMIESCRDAILRAGPFEPLPAQFKNAPQTFMCEFMFNPQSAAVSASPPVAKPSSPSVNKASSVTDQK